MTVHITESFRETLQIINTAAEDCSQSKEEGGKDIDFDHPVIGPYLQNSQEDDDKNTYGAGAPGRVILNIIMLRMG